MENKYEDLDLTKCEGLEVDIRLHHINDENTNQYVSFDIEDLHFSGWIGSVVGEPNRNIKKTVKEMFLLEHKNGGRSYYGQAKTYKEYFNEELRKKVEARRSGGILGAIFGGGGNPDQADILVYFTDGAQLDTTQWIKCPKEWYSEQYTETLEKYLHWGFYESSAEALEAQKSNDDMFGERFFPVAVFPKDTSKDKIDSCVNIPKAVSDPIETQEYICYGSRCKPYEVEDFINEVYNIGGKIIKHATWDW